MNYHVINISELNIYSNFKCTIKHPIDAEQVFSISRDRCKDSVHKRQDMNRFITTRIEEFYGL